MKYIPARALRLTTFCDAKAQVNKNMLFYYIERGDISLDKANAIVKNNNSFFMEGRKRKPKDFFDLLDSCVQQESSKVLS